MEFENTHKAMEKFSSLVVEQAKLNLSKPRRKGRFGRVSKSDDTGALARSLKVQAAPDGATVSMLGYGQWVNEGRKAGKGIPVKELLGWVERKVKPDEDPKSISFLINRSIKLYGIKPTYFLDDAFETVEQMDIQEINDAIFQDIAEAMVEQNTCKL